MYTEEESKFSAWDMSKTGKVIIGAILIVALSIQIYHAFKWETGYDEAWNLYYAKIQPFTKSFLELKHNAHPPLASLWLRIPTFFGDDIFWARLGTIIPSCLSIFFVFLILKKIRLTDPLPYIFAFILAISHTFVNISVCVRAYTLMTLFISIAIYYFIDITRDIKTVKSWKIFIFVLSSLFAIWTEYCASFVIIALLISFFLIILISDEIFSDVIKRIFKEWMSVLIFVCGAIGIVWYFSWTIMPVWQGHVSKHYISPQESILHFGKKGISANISYFTPFVIENKFLLISVVLICAFVTGFLVFRFLKTNPDKGKACILITHILLWGILFIAGVKKIYPFGGSMRHQFILFPFLMISFSIIINELFLWFRNKKLQYLGCGILFIGAAYLSIVGFSGPPIEEYPPAPLFQTEYQGLMKKINKNDFIYLTGFTHYVFFYHTMDWNWEYQRSIGGMCYIFEVRKGNERLHVLTDRTQWLPPIPITEAFVNRLSSILNVEKTKRAWIFSSLQGNSFVQHYNDQAWEDAKKTFENQIQLIDKYHFGNGYAYLTQLN